MIEGFPVWLIYFDFDIGPEVEKKFKGTAFPAYGLRLANRTYLKFKDDMKGGYSGVEMQTMTEATRFGSKEEAESRLVWLCGEAPSMIGSVGVVEWDGR